MRARLWVCPFCFQRNSFPPHYKDISPQAVPPELMPLYTSIEYTLAKPPAMPPVFLFVVDTCLDEDDLKALKDSLIVSLSLIPQNWLVGFITFGTMTQVHEIGYGDCPKSYVFRGNKEYNPKQIGDMLGIGAGPKPMPVRPGQPPVSPAGTGVNRFLLPISQCEFTLTTILEQLQRDPWPVANDRRALRSTGVAMSVAIGLLEVILRASPWVLTIDRLPWPTLVRASCSSQAGRAQRALEWW
jgi:protein transport protein SEC23